MNRADAIMILEDIRKKHYKEEERDALTMAIRTLERLPQIHLHSWAVMNLVNEVKGEK